MIKLSKSRLAAATATAALAVSGIGLTVVSASASSTQCTGITTGPLAGSCGDLATASGYGLSVKAGSNGKVNSGDQVTSSSDLTVKTTDFYAHQTNGNVSERVLEYAPKGNRSGLCVTEASPWGGLTLQRCARNSAGQEFYGIGDTQNDTGNTNGGLQWLNAESGKVIDIGRNKVTMDGLAGSSNVKGTYLHWVG